MDEKTEEKRRAEETNRKIKKRLRLIGSITTPVAALLIIIAFIDFFTAIGNGQPRLFWMFFIGFPLLFVGIVCLYNGNLKEISRYVASEQVPVATDVTNTVLADTRAETVKTVAGIAEAVKGPDKSGDVCPKCGTLNEKGAVYCDHCGAPLAKVCPDCGEVNDGDATFCRKCGKKL